MINRNIRQNEEYKDKRKKTHKRVKNKTVVFKSKLEQM
jgi:hypothetical protein